MLESCIEAAVDGYLSKIVSLLGYYFDSKMAFSSLKVFLYNIMNLNFSFMFLNRVMKAN